MTVHDEIVRIALTQVGVAETGDNGGVPLERYGLPGEDALPWCARFVRWVVNQAGAKIPGNQYELAAVRHMEEEFEHHGWLVMSPQPGDIVFFKFRVNSDAGIGRHVGIVTGVTKNTVQTVEGNSGDKVRSRVYSLPCAAVTSFGRVPA